MYSMLNELIMIAFLIFLLIFVNGVFRFMDGVGKTKPPERDQKDLLSPSESSFSPWERLYFKL
jgi:hypothetical protein